jgi:hypothetical protein
LSGTFQLEFQAISKINLQTKKSLFFHGFFQREVLSIWNPIFTSSGALPKSLYGDKSHISYVATATIEEENPAKDQIPYSVNLKFPVCETFNPEVHKIAPLTKEVAPLSFHILILKIGAKNFYFLQKSNYSKSHPSLWRIWFLGTRTSNKYSNH